MFPIKEPWTRRIYQSIEANNSSCMEVFSTAKDFNNLR